MREMMADLLLEDGRSAQALLEYQTVLKTAPRRFNATAGAAMAAAAAADTTKARAYAGQLLDLAASAETSRPALEWCRAYLRSR